MTTRLRVDVVSGEGYPVAWVDVEARYEYPTAPAQASHAWTDGEGTVRFVDTHVERPRTVSLVVDGYLADVHPVTPDMSVVVEL